MRDPTPPPSALTGPQLHVGYALALAASMHMNCLVPVRLDDRRLTNLRAAAHVSDHDIGQLEERTLPQFAALAKLLEATCQFEYLEIRR